MPWKLVVLSLKQNITVLALLGCTSWSKADLNCRFTLFTVLYFWKIGGDNSAENSTNVTGMLFTWYAQPYIFHNISKPLSISYRAAQICYIVLHARSIASSFVKIVISNQSESLQWKFDATRETMLHLCSIVTRQRSIKPCSISFSRRGW